MSPKGSPALVHCTVATTSTSPRTRRRTIPRRRTTPSPRTSAITVTYTQEHSTTTPPSTPTPAHRRAGLAIVLRGSRHPAAAAREHVAVARPASWVIWTIPSPPMARLRRPRRIPLSVAPSLAPVLDSSSDNRVAARHWPSAPKSSGRDERTKNAAWHPYST